MNPEIRALCDFLEQLLHGTIRSKEAFAKLTFLSARPIPGLESVYADLHHYIADEDIRAKDPEYRELQDSEMKKLIARLEAGELAKANQVTFLGKT